MYYFDDFPCKGEAYGNRANIEYSDENRKTTMVFWHAYPLSKQPDLNRQAKKVFLVLFMFFPISWVGNTIAFPGSSQACHSQIREQMSGPDLYLHSNFNLKKTVFFTFSKSKK